MQSQPAIEITRARPLLGTLVQIGAAGEDERQVNAAIESAFNSVEKVHALMSYHDADSDVSRVNRDAFEHPVRVHAHTWRVLSAAHGLAEASNGLFDVTIAPILARMGYLPRHPGVPRSSGQSDWRHIRLLPGEQVHLARRLRIDLGGIAKGYAVDLAIHALQRAGMMAGRVNAGGDLRVFGTAMQTIHVRHPHRATVTRPLIQIQCGAVATSASYFSARLRRGRWVTPLIHPIARTCCPAGRSVSVLARDCVIADALTKVVHADPQRALGVLGHYHARAVVQDQDPVTGGCRMMHNDAGRWQVQLLPDCVDD